MDAGRRDFGKPRPRPKRTKLQGPPQPRSSRQKGLIGPGGGDRWARGGEASLRRLCISIRTDGHGLLGARIVSLRTRVLCVGNGRALRCAAGEELHRGLSCGGLAACVRLSLVHPLAARGTGLFQPATRALRRVRRLLARAPGAFVSCHPPTRGRITTLRFTAATLSLWRGRRSALSMPTIT